MKKTGVDPAQPKTKFEQTVYQRNLFMVMALNMTWQLAIVVLVPVIGGYYLDQHFSSTPVWLIVGAVLAVLGMIGVLKRTLALAGQRTSYSTSAKTGGKK